MNSIPDKDLPVVISFPRSGTHWLCSLTYQWFYWGQIKAGFYKSTPGVPFYVWGKTDIPCPWAALEGRHIYDPSSSQAQEFIFGRKIIYLFRNPRGVLASFWRIHRQHIKISHGIDIPPFKDYLKLPAMKYADAAEIAANPIPLGLTTRSLWDWSYERWVKCAPFCVSYEDLVNKQEVVRDRLSEYLGMSPCDLRYPSSEPVGFCPDKEGVETDSLWEMVK